MKQLDTKLMHPADQIVIIIRRIYRGGMTTTTGGNISIKDEYGDIWITPGSVDKGTLTRDDIMRVTPDGSVIGKHKPSSEFPFHKALYDLRPDMTAVIHAHPPALVAFSIVHEIPNTNIVPQAKEVCGDIGFAPYALPGSEELGENIARVFKDNPEYKAVIMENHGVVLCGVDIMDAYQRFETLEFCGMTLINAFLLGKPKYLTDEQIDNYKKKSTIDYPNFEDVSYPSDERAIRRDIVDLVRKACDQQLMISSYGTVSVRWKDNDFLITPTGMPRWLIAPEDIVQVKGGKVESGKTPSRSTYIHKAIYQANPEINSIILTQPSSLMAYCVTDKEINVRTIPESWIFLKDIPKVPFGSQFSDEDTLMENLKDLPCVLIENDSVIVTGNSLMHAFDRLEVAELSAKSLLMGKTIGKLHPIADKQVEELRVAFKVK